MTPDDYLERSLAIRQDINRCRALLTDATTGLKRGVQPSSGLMGEIHRHLNDALQQLGELDNEFFGHDQARP